MARRVVVALAGLVVAAGLVWLMARALAPGGWTPGKAGLLVATLAVVPWLGLTAANTLACLWVLATSPNPAAAVLPFPTPPDDEPLTLRTLLAVTVRQEDTAAVLGTLKKLAGSGFTPAILSDTPDGAEADAEAAAIRAAGVPGLLYRRRSRNDGFKAGNVMSFLDSHAADFDAAILLDADSDMTPEAARRLVRLLQAAPGVAIIQHLTVGSPAAAAFPRLFQFGMRAGMRVWAIGQAWWQGDAGPYWGHNAILRIAPFRAHARLGKLPDGGDILSHDQVEAARLRAAGWGVCVWADESGSFERHPPALPEFLRRDARWAAGNMQYRHLVAAPGFAAMGRWQMLQAILLFATAPVTPVMWALAAWCAAADDPGFPAGRVAAITAAWVGVFFAPKLVGFAQVLGSERARGRWGGTRLFLSGVLVETLFTLLLDAAGQFDRTITLAGLLAGRAVSWPAQNRDARTVSWREAAARFWPHTLFGVAVFGGLAVGGWTPVLWALPFAGGLLTVIPFCVLTASDGFSAWLARHRIAATPESLVLIRND